MIRRNALETMKGSSAKAKEGHARPEPFNEDRRELSEVHICQRHSTEDEPVKWATDLSTHREAVHTRQFNHGIVGGERTCGGEQ